MPKIRKNFYATVYNGIAKIFTSWPECERYLQINKGHKSMKGFVTKLEAEEWLKTHGCSNYNGKDKFRKPKADTKINREFRKTVMDWFRSLERKQKLEVMVEFNSFKDMWTN